MRTRALLTHALLTGTALAVLTFSRSEAALPPARHLRPGAQVTLSGVQVRAPQRWRTGQPTGVSITVTRLTTPPVPLPAGTAPALPVYAVRADKTVLTADAGRFLIRLPIGTADPRSLVGLRVTEVVLDAIHPRAPAPKWQSDAEARVSGGYLEFQTTGFTAGSSLLFTALRRDTVTA